MWRSLRRCDTTYPPSHVGWPRVEWRRNPLSARSAASNSSSYLLFGFAYSSFVQPKPDNHCRRIFILASSASRPAGMMRHSPGAPEVHVAGKPLDDCMSSLPRPRGPAVTSSLAAETAPRSGLARARMAKGEALSMLRYGDGYGLAADWGCWGGARLEAGGWCQMASTGLREDHPPAPPFSTFCLLPFLSPRPCRRIQHRTTFPSMNAAATGTGVEGHGGSLHIHSHVEMRGHANRRRAQRQSQ